MKMATPLVSIVIPAYNQADFVGEAIQSVLDQTYQNFEVLVVNDASQDNTHELVNQFDDPRVRQIHHPQNRGLPASRNSGMRASVGEYIALLDADDYFQHEKLAIHVDFLERKTEVGSSYNSRFELNHSSNTIRELWLPLKKVNLADFILGFPFSPSDMVIKREWAFAVGLFDESFISGGEDTDFPCRLALAGCQFEGVERALNFRRYHSGRGRKNLPGRLDDVSRALKATFNDPRCPKDTLALRPLALKHHLMVLASLAFIQGESDLGQEYTRQVIKIDPNVLRGERCELIEFFLMESVADENVNHVDLLKTIFAQLPPEIAEINDQYDWSVAYGFLLKGVRNIIWDRANIGKSQLEKAGQLGVAIDELFLERLIHQLLGFENEFGSQQAIEVIERLLPLLERIGSRKSAKRLMGTYMANKAFQDYRSNNFSEVPAKVVRAVANDPSLAINRGILSIFLRSIAGRLNRPPVEQTF